MKFVPHDRAVAVDLHQARLHEPIDPRIQRTNARGQLGRKHVNRAIGKIDRGGPFIAFQVERAAFAHVVRDVGDMHPEPIVAVRQPLEADGIVEIARMLAVDRHGDGLPEIGAAGDLARADGPEGLRFLDRGVAVGVGDAEFPDDDLGVDPLFVDIAEHLDDSADRAARGRWPQCDLGHDHLARLSAGRRPGRDVYVGEDAPIERLHIAESRLEHKLSDDGRAAALENPDDSALEPPVSRLALDASQHAIAVHRLFDVRRRHVHVRRGVAGLVGNDEPEAVCVGLEPAHHEIHLVGKPDTASVGLDELAGRAEGFDEPAECRALLTRNFQSANQVSRGGRMRDLVAHQFKDLFFR